MVKIMKFEIKNPNYKLSPFTGLTREHWINAGKFLLDSVFSNVKDFNAPIVVERVERKITYPHLNLNYSKEAIIREEKAQRFEGLARSFLIASLLINDNPNITCNGFLLREYYKNQILLAVQREGENSIGWYSDVITSSSTSIVQQTVESAGLCVGLYNCKDYIWNTYSTQEKNLILDFISEYAYGNTNGNNWQFFNMLDLAFLKMNGREIDRKLMEFYAKNMLSYYAGDGWYRDGWNFDYYSVWAFNFEAPLWNVWYGYDNMKDIALEFEKNSNLLMKTFPDYFDKDGHMLMWGRSNIYRFAVGGAIAGNMILKKHAKNYGNLRRVVSGALLQFMQRDDFMGENGVPTMGFYGQFSQLVQSYSCTESVLWIGRAFSLLALPKNHPFWTTRERKGTFERLSKKGVKETVLNSSALAFTNHRANGTTILRTGRVLQNPKNSNGCNQYAKLSYSSKYPWEASLKEAIDPCGYVIKVGDEYSRANVIYWCGEKKGVLYRREYFNYDFINKSKVKIIDLADFVVPCGIFRADRFLLRKKEDAQITLSSYGFPDNGTKIVKKSVDGATALILKGYDKMGKQKQMAFTIYGDFKVFTTSSEGTNADSEKSIVVSAMKKIVKSDYSCPLFFSQTLTIESHEDFNDEELFPIKTINNIANGVKITLKSGVKKLINFIGVESNMQM